jgi:hypothetical protein
MIRSQQLQHTIQKLSIMDVCNIMLTIGVVLLILGKFTRPLMHPILGFVIIMCGHIAFLIGTAMFVAIARVVLDY